MDANCTHYIVPGVDADLAQKVCAGLYLKRQNLSVVPIDLEKMAVHFGASKEDLVRIIKWYEGELISTKFDITE